MTELAPGIISDPSIHFGKPVIKGTRVPAEIVVSHIASGISVKDVAKEYGITEQDVYNTLNYAAKHLAEVQITTPSRINSSLRGKLYWPNKFGLITFEALEKITDKRSFERISDSVGLSRDFKHWIPDNLEKSFDFVDISALCAGLDDFYGATVSIDIAHRVGEDGFLIGLRDFGALAGLSKAFYSILPYRTKLRMSLKASARVLSQISDQSCVVAERENEFLLSIHECPYCLGRTASNSACHMFGGFLTGLVKWATGDQSPIIEERKCKARGDEVCEFSIKKKTLS